MDRKANDRASHGERTNDRSDRMNEESESLGSVNGMEAGRAERTRSAGAHGDAQAGDEGVDDPSMSRTHRDDMSTTPAHGDRLKSSEKSSQRDASQRSRRTEGRANDERFDNATDFGGQGGQKEGPSEEAEGTGYTDDSETSSRSR
jgi:hypothetical protein